MGRCASFNKTFLPPRLDEGQTLPRFSELQSLLRIETSLNSPAVKNTFMNINFLLEKISDKYCEKYDERENDKCIWFDVM